MTTEAEQENVGNIPQEQLYIHKQYLKDMSFENPNSPEILKSISERPDMDINVMLDVQKLEHDEIKHFYEVVMTLNTTAKINGEIMFIAEISYAATASIYDMDEKQHHPALFIRVPQMIFPFVRQILANATLAGGFFPLMPKPVDFFSMYMKRFGEQANVQTENVQKQEEA